MTAPCGLSGLAPARAATVVLSTVQFYPGRRRSICFRHQLLSHWDEPRADHHQQHRQRNLRFHHPADKDEPDRGGTAWEILVQNSNDQPARQRANCARPAASGGVAEVKSATGATAATGSDDRDQPCLQH
jgi:hypothetical protein